jgi:hypothetical protein
MPFIVKEEKREFVPAPAGPQQAVCCDFIDLGVQPTEYGPKHRIELRWLLAEVNEDGKPFMVRNWYNVSFHEKAGLRLDIEAWLGRKLTDHERTEGFDVEWLIGKNCFLNVVHKVKENATFANVGAVMPLPKGLVPIDVPLDYVRVKDRKDK